MKDVFTVNACKAANVERVQSTPTVDSVIAWVSSCRDPAVLDSADTSPGRGRFTVVTCDPVEVAVWRAGQGDPFEGMRRALDRTGLADVSGSVGENGDLPEDARGAFLGGWIGYYAYEAGRYLERLPATTAADVGLPIARFALYDTAAVHDAVTGRWSVTSVRWSGQHPSKRAEEKRRQRVARWHDLLRQAQESPPEPVTTPALPLIAENMTHEQYLAMVAKAKEYIAAGDVFQVNLARRISFPVQEPLAETYRRLRQANPGAYAAFLLWDDEAGRDRHAILSVSPELFLRLRGRRVWTRPIKGTIARSADAVVDAINQAGLCSSEKDRAELAMIVDLERNDLGRVCEFGSVKVVAGKASAATPYELEVHPTVHHLVATVEGTLRQGADAIDLLQATFPGGSITGAPKVRSMEIIDELEPTERSVYTGAIGWFGLDGSMTMNIAIRTLIASGNQLHLYAGGGIVADSIPEAEFEETRAKAKGLSRALGVPERAGLSVDR